MPTTIAAIGFLIYALMLTGTLIYLWEFTQATYQNHKKLLQNGIRTQAKITAVYHPQKRKKTSSTSIAEEKKSSDDTEENRIVVAYEYEVKDTTAAAKTLVGEFYVHLDWQNTSIIKNRYKVGQTIDVLYLKDDSTIVDIAHHVLPPKGEYLLICANIAALVSSLLVLGLLVFVGLSDTVDTVNDALSMVFGFLLYVFMLTGNVVVIMAGMGYGKDYFKLLQLKKKGIKEKGEVLEVWKMRAGRGGINYFVRYTYPAIAPFSIERTVHQRLYEDIQKNKIIEIRYFKTDAFSSDIVGNKKTVYAFWLFMVLAPLMTLFVAWVFYEFVLFDFF